MKLSIATLLNVLYLRKIFATASEQDQPDGISVITSLNLADTSPNAVTRYLFLAGVAQGTIPYYVLVLIARGAKRLSRPAILFHCLLPCMEMS